LAAAAVTASVVAVVATSASARPAPVAFALTDETGRWFDSGVEAAGGRAFAVAELPRAGVPADADVEGLLNEGEDDAEQPVTTRRGPKRGDAGRALVRALNIDRTVAAVRAVGAAHPAVAPQAARAESLLGQLVAELATLPADAPVGLPELAVGPELTATLATLRAAAPADTAVTVSFTVDPKRSRGERNPVGAVAPEGAQGFPFADPTGPFVGTRTVQLTDPGLYVFADSVVPDVLGAVLVDDPLTVGLDFGPRLRIAGPGGETVVPSTDDLVQSMVDDFFTATIPDNRPRPSSTEEVPWSPRHPAVPVLQQDAAGDPVLVPNLDAYFDRHFGYPRMLPRTAKPKARGIGTVLVSTPAVRAGTGTLTRIDATDWVARAVAADLAAPLPGAPLPAATGPAPAAIETRVPTAAGAFLPGGVAGAGGGLGGGDPAAPAAPGAPAAPTALTPPGAQAASPDGLAAVTVDGLARQVTVTDPQTRTVAAEMPCDAGCESVAVGPKQGGGYLAYVLNTLSNVVQVIDLDPNGDGRVTDARIAGRLSLEPLLG
jgi:hypothetical protein